MDLYPLTKEGEEQNRNLTNQKVKKYENVFLKNHAHLLRRGRMQIVVN